MGLIDEAGQLLIQKEKQERMERLTEKINQSREYINILQEIMHELPVYYDKNKIWWLWSWNEKKWEMVDETDILISIKESLNINDIAKNKIRTEILESLKIVGRMNAPIEPPINWIHFKNYVYDIETQKKFTPTPKYFFMNPITRDIGESEETPIIDKLFNEWVGEERKEMLYEIIGYCLYRDYPIHRIFCLIGGGRNGKSRYLALIQRFLGINNICTTDLDLLVDNRFETAKLFKKLVCIMGETNYNDLKNTSMLKKLVGQDTIGFEFKNKNPFDEINYAKILIATNSLPLTHDKTDGFYRRWIIIDFPNQFPEGKDILKTIPEQEFNNLALKVLNKLCRLLENTKFTNELNILEKQKMYEEKSNPFNSYISTKCVRGVSYEVPLFDLFDDFTTYLKDNGYREISKRAFTQSLRDDGYEIEKKHVDLKDGKRSTWNFVVGIRFKNKLLDTLDTKDTQNLTRLYRKELSENRVSSVSMGIQTSQINELVSEIGTFKRIQKTLLKCNKCGESGKWTLENLKDGKVWCDICANISLEEKNIYLPEPKEEFLEDR